jgi:hypothetical protein
VLILRVIETLRLRCAEATIGRFHGSLFPLSLDAVHSRRLKDTYPLRFHFLEIAWCLKVSFC